MTSSCSGLTTLLLASLLVMVSVHCVSVTPLSPKLRMKARETVFDWRRAGVISPVADQGQPDSQAVVVAEGVESLHAIFNQLVILSRQQVADCCDDGLHHKHQGYNCVAVIGGLCSYLTYKPSGANSGNRTCQPVGKVTATGYIPPNREDLMFELIHRTPLSAAVDASQGSFQTYSRGIYSNANCSSTKLDHFVQVVGYGTTSQGQDYWIIKNSWGVEWGEKGYMRIVRSKNMCGIATDVFYPINQDYIKGPLRSTDLLM